MLVAVRNHLRTELSLRDHQCGIEPDGLIPGIATQLYVTVDEGDTVNKDMVHLDEVLTIEIRVCRQVGRTTGDKRGNMLEPDDLYLANMKTLDDLGQNVKRFLHNNHTVRIAANALLGISAESVVSTATFDPASGNTGDRFSTPMFFKRQGKSFVMPNERGDEWLQRPLFFEGGRRVQNIATAR